MRNTHCIRIQSLSHGYATTTRQCHKCLICYTALAVLLPLPKNKSAPSITEDIHAKFPLEQWTNENCLLFCLCLDRNVHFYVHPASHYCVYLSLFELPRNRYAKRETLMYKPIIFLPKMSDCKLIASKQSIRYGHTLIFNCN